MVATWSRRPARSAVLVCAALALACALVAAPGATAGSGALEAKVRAARGEASALAAELRAKQASLAAAERQAAAAAARERTLSALLAKGEERAAALAAKVEAARRRLAVERARLRRARAALAARLVAIYESGEPDALELALAAGDVGDLATWTRYLEQIHESDTALAARVEQVRNSVRRGLRRVAELKARVDAYNDRLAAARSQVSAVRRGAEEAAAHLQAVAAAREAALARLKADIGSWVAEIRAARAAAAEAASRAEAEDTVGRWLGGPYSIPAYIVMCESGGDYGAVNPSSGAGGAYQILPSTWALYGGKGSPESAPKSEQDRIAAEIWADSGPGAWVCGG